MTAEDWAKVIHNACIEANTYRPFFDSVIKVLAEIMELRDDAVQRYHESGAETVVVHINRSGAENVAKNPALTVIMDCNTQALAYWRDLGLTPAGYKRLNSTVQEKPETFETMLSKIVSE